MGPGVSLLLGDLLIDQVEPPPKNPSLNSHTRACTRCNNTTKCQHPGSWSTSRQLSASSEIRKVCKVNVALGKQERGIFFPATEMYDFHIPWKEKEKRVYNELDVKTRVTLSCIISRSVNSRRAVLKLRVLEFRSQTCAVTFYVSLHLRRRFPDLALSLGCFKRMSDYQHAIHNKMRYYKTYWIEWYFNAAE